VVSIERFAFAMENQTLFAVTDGPLGQRMGSAVARRLLVWIAVAATLAMVVLQMALMVGR
jgi:hypothetical protein